jgi:hypothetical protein
VANLTTVAVLLWAGPKPMTLEEKKLRQHLQLVLNVAAEQQAKILASWRCEARAPNKECSVHRGPSCPIEQPNRVESVHSPAGHRTDSNHEARGASSARGRTMT